MNKEKIRKPLRLNNFDYSSHNAYFVTICTQGRKCLLSNIENEEFVELTQIGKITEKQWYWIETRFSNASLDEYVIMPNHIHGIITLDEKYDSIKKPLGQIIGAFKTTSTKLINDINKTPKHQFWQRGFHDRIIRNERELSALREYIKNNPLKWHLDVENPKRIELTNMAARERPLRNKSFKRYH
ncbi:MAG: transposase [Deltaproteobacteria bacterium]|nr:transposase [Deltaproteobacteria bacterium]